MTPDMNDQAEFEEHMKEMSDRELMEFTARSVYTHGVQIKSLQNSNKKRLGISGGISAAVAAGIVMGFNWLTGKSS